MPVVTRAQTLREAQEELERIMSEPHREVEIVCLPPNAAAESDLEDVSEDEMGAADPKDVPGELEIQYDSDSDVEDKPKRKKTGMCCYK